jgi:hypothetical protein
VAVNVYTQTIHRTTQITNEQHKWQLMWKSAGRASSLRVLRWHLPYNWGKSTKNLSQVKKNLSQSTVYILAKHPHKHTNYNPPPTHTHTTKQYKTTTVQIKTNTVKDIPKWNSHSTIKCPQFKVTLMYIIILFSQYETRIVRKIPRIQCATIAEALTLSAPN